MTSPTTEGVSHSDEEGIKTIVQDSVREKDRHLAQITLLDGQRLDVYVHKNAEGDVLFNLVCDHIALIEKDYFSLAFYDEHSTRKWLYKNKKISKQVKELPWEFTLEVKFYTPEPQDLHDDFTRHLLTLQLRADLYNEKLPATFGKLALLGSLIAQAELADYKPEVNYQPALRALSIVKQMTPELSEAICKFYKDQKGKTPPEAELAFLNACRTNSMYGMSMFDAKEKNQPVRIGINAHGICVFNGQLRSHFVVWQSMHQLEYQRKSFTIKLKPGEKEGKNHIVLKLNDEAAAKRCWKTAVDHHTFFRLLQPNEKSNSLFGFGSARRPEGRTLIQAKMASQMFDGTPAATQTSAAHLVSRSPENPTYQPASPVEEDEGGRVIVESTTRTYHIETREAISPRTEATNGAAAHEEPEEKKQKERSKSKHDTSSSSSSSSVEVEERHHVLHSEEKTEHTKRTERSTAFASNDPPKHTNDPQRMESSGWGAVGGGHQTSLSPFTALPISAASPLQTDEFVEESETISSKVITTGNRTVETVTYTTKKDGVENTRVEHRVTVNEEPDSEAAVKRAIAEATGLRSYQVHGLAVPVHQHE